MKSTGTVADWGERRLVRRIRSIVGELSPPSVGAGDDAAVIDLPNGSQVVLSTDRVPTDLLARRLGMMTFRDLGRYLVEVNVSDIVAMGASPSGLVLNLGLTPDTPVTDLFELVESAASRAEELGSKLLGGDTKVAAEDSFVATAVGYVNRGDALLRGTAQPGDQLAVSGDVGAFGAALSYFFREDTARRVTPEIEVYLTERLVRPVARFDLLGVLRTMKCSACIDITDGLGESIRELERAGECAFDVDINRVPVDPVVHAVAELLNLEWKEIVLGIGLDLELLVCSSSEVLPEAFTIIGSARETGGEASRIRLSNGDFREIPGGSFEHFSRDARDFVSE